MFLHCCGLDPLASFCFPVSPLVRFLSLLGLCWALLRDVVSGHFIYLQSVFPVVAELLHIKRPILDDLTFLCDGLCAGQHCLVRDMFLFQILSHVVVSLC